MLAERWHRLQRGASQLGRVAVKQLDNELSEADALGPLQPQNPRQAGVALIVLGQPRAATTFLQHLLASDPRWRGVLGWEAWGLGAVAPLGARPFERAELTHRAARLERIRRRLFREASQLHHQALDLPEECGVLLRGRLTGRHPLFFLDGEDLVDGVRLTAEDLEWYAAVLSLLGKAPHQRWLLKDPTYMLSIGELRAAFPDAVLCTIERPSETLVPSLARLLSAMQKPLGGQAGGRDYERTAAQLVREFERAIHGHDDTLVRFQFDEMITDPLRTISVLYERLGMDLPTDLHDTFTTAAARLQSLHRTGRGTG